MYSVCPFQTELSIKSGDRLVVFGEPDVDGFYYAELEGGGRRGYVPADCIQPASASAGQTSTSRTGSRSSTRPTSAGVASVSTSSVTAPGHHQQPTHPTSSSAPPPSTRGTHHHQDMAPSGSTSSHRSTSRRHDELTPAAGGPRAAATLPRPTRTSTDPLTGANMTGGGGRADSSTTRHRRQ